MPLPLLQAAFLILALKVLYQGFVQLKMFTVFRDGQQIKFFYALPPILVRHAGQWVQAKEDLTFAVSHMASS